MPLYLYSFPQKILKQFVVEGLKEAGINQATLVLECKNNKIEEERYELLTRALKMIVKSHDALGFEGAKYILESNETVVRIKVILTEKLPATIQTEKKVSNKYGAWKFVSHEKGDYITAIFSVDRYRELVVQPRLREKIINKTTAHGERVGQYA